MIRRRHCDRHPHGGDEAGAALIMAVIVMAVLTTLTTLVLARTLSVMDMVRDGQDYDAALAAADAGIADALFKVDQSAPASWTASGTAGSGTFEYWAKKISETEYIVGSVGRVGKARHGVQVRVTRTAKFQYALFADGPLHLDGAASAGNVKVTFFDVAGSNNGIRVGSNATVVCNGTLPDNVFVDWYQSQAECPTTKITRLEKPRDLTITEPPMPGGITDVNWENCPIGGVFGSTDGSVVQISGDAGPYVCRQDVTMLGKLEAAPGEDAVEIYIAPRYNSDGSTTHYELDMSSATINIGQSAERFQIYKVGDEPIRVNPGNDLSFRGVMFAPETPLTVNGGHLTWAGSTTVSQIKINGTPNLQIGYDLGLSTYYGPDWRVSRYREIPSTQAKPAVFP